MKHIPLSFPEIKIKIIYFKHAVFCTSAVFDDYNACVARHIAKPVDIAGIGLYGDLRDCRKARNEIC